MIMTFDNTVLWLYMILYFPIYPSLVIFFLSLCVHVVCLHPASKACSPSLLHLYIEAVYAFVPIMSNLCKTVLCRCIYRQSSLWSVMTVSTISVFVSDLKEQNEMCVFRFGNAMEQIREDIFLKNELWNVLKLCPPINLFVLVFRVKKLQYLDLDYIRILLCIMIMKPYI